MINKNYAYLKSKSEKSVSSAQAGVLMFVVIVAMRIIMSPTIITEVAGRDAYIAFAINAIITALCVYLICFVIKRNAKLSFDQILQKVFGKFLTKVLLVFFLFFFVFKFLIVDFGMETFLLETLYEFLNWKLFIIPIFLVIMYVGYKGARTIARAARIFSVFAVAILILVLTLSIFNANFSELMPFMEHGFMPVAKGAFFSFAKTGEYLFLFIIADKLIPDKKLTVNTVSASLIASAFVFCFILLYTCVFGNMAPILREGLIKIIQFKRSVPSSFRLDGIIIVFWFPMTIIYAGLNFYCASCVFKKLFNIESTKVSILLVGGLTFMLKFVPVLENTQIYEISKDIFAYVSVGLQVVLPIILAIYFAIKKVVEPSKKAVSVTT